MPKRFWLQLSQEELELILFSLQRLNPDSPPSILIEKITASVDNARIVTGPTSQEIPTEAVDPELIKRRMPA